MRKGAVGGDRGWAAAAAVFRFAVDIVVLLPAGDKMKKRNPTESIAAKMIVIGLVRRMALGKAIVT